MKLIETGCRSGFSLPVEAEETPSLFRTYPESNTLGDVQSLPEQGPEQPDTALVLTLL